MIVAAVFPSPPPAPSSLYPSPSFLSPVSGPESSDVAWLETASQSPALLLPMHSMGQSPGPWRDRLALTAARLLSRYPSKYHY